jgi:hypothetical protein
MQMLTGDESIAITPDHEYYPFPPGMNPSVGDRVGLEEEGPKSGYFGASAGTHSRRGVAPIEHGPFYCHVPDIDLMYLFVFTFGLDTFGHFTEQVGDRSLSFWLTCRREPSLVPTSTSNGWTRSRNR